MDKSMGDLMMVDLHLVTLWIYLRLEQ